jgi:hypothetical protein
VTHPYEVTDLNRRFCVLEYRPIRDESCELPREHSVFLLVIEKERRLQFLVPLDFRSLVDQADLEYIKQLLKDLPKRAQRDAQVLFDQLCSLSVGPLVTRRVGTCNAHSSDFDQICTGFIPI